MAARSDFSRSVIGGSDEVPESSCEPCGQDGRQTEAEGFCVECSEYMCRQCYKNHKLFKAFRNHELCDKNATGVVVKDKCSTMCEIHTDKVIEYFCRSCDTLGCTICITLDHRQCEKVEHIPNIVENSTYNEEFKTFVEKVRLVSKEIQDMKSSIASLPGISDNMRLTAKTELAKQLAEINKIFDDLEKEMDTKIDEIHNSNAAYISDIGKTCDTMCKNLTDLESNIITKQNTGQQCEAFIAMKGSVRDFNSVTDQFQNMQKESKLVSFKVIPSSQGENIKTNITEICTLETKTMLLGDTVTMETKTENNHPSLAAASSSISQDSTQKLVKPPKLTSLALNMEINVKSDKDQQSSYVRGLATIYGHFIVVVDRPNNSVKVIDIKTKNITSELVLDKAVWSVTKVNDDKIAVGMKSAIQFLTVSKTGLLTEDNTFETKMTCFDVVHSNGELIVAQGSFIEIMTMQGQVLKTIEYSPEGQQLFISCYGLAISKDRKTMYASDNTKNTVTSLTFEGKVKDVYRDNDLKNPWGMTIDNGGNVYVCCCGLKSLKTVHQLSADCHKLQVFPDMPGGSITCTDTNQILVGGVENLRIYDIK